MSDSNSTLIIVIIAAVLVGLIFTMCMNKKKCKKHQKEQDLPTERFTQNYLQNVAVGNEPLPNQVFSMPSFRAALDPRFESQGVSGMRGGPAAPMEMMGFPTSGGSMYTAQDMISMGGCAKATGSYGGANFSANGCPSGQEYPKWAVGGDKISVPVPAKNTAMTESGVSQDFADTEQAFGRFSTYQNAVKAEDMLPKPDIAANVDPSQYVVYDRNMGSMMMKSGNRTPVDYIRGDVIPVTRNNTPTISAKIGDPDSPMFVPRFGSDIGTLQRGYFTNYNDVVQVLEERNASYFMTKAQADRNKLKQDAGML